MPAALTPCPYWARYVVLACLIPSFCSCDWSSTDLGEKVPVASVEVLPETGTIETGQTLQLTATPKDEAGNLLNRKVTWTSADPGIAKVNRKGLVTVLAKGVVGVKATCGGVEGEATVRVIEVGAYNCTLQSEIAEKECWGLVALFESMGGPGWGTSWGWLVSDRPCSWYGVTCAGGSVSELNFFGRGLAGSIPPEIGDLPNLERLQLANNSELTGPIPAEVGNLQELRALHVWLTEVNGPIPPELGELSNLVELDLHSTQLEGPIPASLGNLSNLEEMDLGGTPLGGPIPPELGNLVSLRELSLSNSYLIGPIPADLGSLTSLERLVLSYNQLSGPIPAELGGLSHLEWLFLDKNQLSGPIPPALGGLSTLVWLNADGNGLSGPIPPELGGLSSLESLWLSNNSLTGPIPSEIRRLSNLAALILVENELTGPIPIELGELSALGGLALGGNQLSGPIPAELGGLSNLVLLDLTANQLSGVVPPEVARLGGQIEEKEGWIVVCKFVPPGNEGLFMPDIQEYHDADLDGDGLICGLGFTAVQERPNPGVTSRR